MTVIDLHPDELIDRARRGTLSADDRVRLDEHLAGCVACRFECAVRADLAVAAQSSNEPDGLQALVSGALLAAGRSEPPVVVAAGGARRRTPRWAWALVASLVLVSGIATAQSALIASVVTFARVHIEGVLGTRARTTTAPRTAHRKPQVPRAVPAPQLPEASAPVGLDVAPPVSEPVKAADIPSHAPSQPEAAVRRVPSARGQLAVQVRGTSRARATSAARSRAATSARAGSSSVPGGIAPPYVPAGSLVPGAARLDAPAPPVDVAPAAAPVNAAPPSTAAVEVRDAARERSVDARSVAALLFEQANGLRRDGRTRDAAARYRELGARFPQSPEARLSLVLLGKLELDHGDARAALGRFDAYVATGEQALREQALAGRARALLRLDREGAACDAFADLLRAFPSSAYAPVARARCEKE